MNYQPVRSENQANKHAGPQEANHNAGTKDNIDAGDSEKEDESAQDYFVLPIWSSYSSIVKRSIQRDASKAPTKHPDLKTDENPVDNEDQVLHIFGITNMREEDSACSCTGVQKGLGEYSLKGVCLVEQNYRWEKEDLLHEKYHH
ncbi:hypothetical protein Tco_1236006 [Tanacetum coccineum]